MVTPPLPAAGRRKQAGRGWSDVPRGPTFPQVTRYRFLDAMGDAVAEEDFDCHADALAWATATDGPDEEVQRVEHLGEQGDWRWAGALGG